MFTHFTRFKKSINIDHDAYSKMGFFNYKLIAQVNFTVKFSQKIDKKYYTLSKMF